MTVVNYTPEQWQAAFERADDRALEYKARARAANARIAELEAALTRINHGEGRTATDLQRIAASALAQKGKDAD